MLATYDNALSLLRRLVRVFFTRVEVTGLDHVPAQGGGLVVAWHPNGLIDPLLIAASCPRRMTFGARHGLFRWPLIGPLIRALGTVPIYRADDAQGAASDDAARRERNRQSLDALAQAIANGSLSALFPEGISHDAPHLTDLKHGAARLYQRALLLTPPGAPPPVLLPVGLHYDDKHLFRSRALVAFHPPLQLPAELLQRARDESESVARETTIALTAEIRRALEAIVRPTESWQLHHAMHRTRTLLRAERAQRAGTHLSPSDMHERELAFSRIWQAYNARRQSSPEQAAALLTRVERYDAELRALGLHDHELDDDPRVFSPLLAVVLALQAVLVYLLLPPILVAGYVINAGPYYLLDVIAKRSAKLNKDLATVKVFGGLLLFPLTWLGAAALAAMGVIDLQRAYPAVPNQPLWAAAFVFSLGVAGGFVAVRYAERMQETWRALRVRLTRRRYRTTLAQLRDERAQLHDAIEAMGEGIALPGRVAEDGRIVHV